MFDFASSDGSGAASSITLSHTTSGTNRYLACGVAVQDTSKTVTSLTFNGVALTRLTFFNNPDSPGRESRAEYWYLVNPPATTASVVVTLSASTAVAAGCVSFTEVSQSTPHGTAATGKGDAESTSLDVSSVSGELVLDVMSMRVGTTPIIVGAGQTEQVNKVSGAGFGNATLGMSTEAGATTTTMTWSVAAGQGAKAWTAIGVSLKGATSSGGGSTIKVCASGCPYDNSQLQSALDAAIDGDEVLLETAHSYPAPSTGFVMGKKCVTPTWDCITIRTGVTALGVVMSTALFPATGARVTAADAAIFAKIVPTANNEAALRTVYPGETGSSCSSAPCLGNGWTVKWIEFPPKAGSFNRALVRFGTNNAGKEFQGGVWVSTLPGGETQDTLVEIPQYLTLIQCYVHGDAFAGQHQGLILASKDARVLHNLFDDIKSFTETQAITGLNGLGPYDIENNQISATGENVIFGGADTYLRLTATVTGTPTASTIQLATPLWVHLDATTQAASFATDIYSGIFISILHAGTEYGGIKCTFSVDTCTLSPTLSFTPTAGDTVRWSWQMGGLTFKYNYVYKRPEWINTIVPTTTGVTVTAQSGGSLAAGTYCYRVATVGFVSGGNATSTSSAEQCATVGASGKAHVSWTADANALSYRVYARTSGSQNVFFTVTAPTTTFDDTGAAGTAGTPPAQGDIWPVKNNFELKQGDGASPMGPILIEGNRFSWSWCCAQFNIISLKANNQNTNDVSATIRGVTMRNNWTSHGNRWLSLTCTSTGNGNGESPSGPMTDVTIENNLVTDLRNTYVGLAGTTSNSALFITSGSYADAMGSKGCVRVSIKHNTILAETDSLNGPMVISINTSADKLVDLVVRDNIMARDCITASCISNGVRTLKGFAPNNLGNNVPTTAWNGTTTGSSFADHNAWPDGTVTQYTAGPFTNPFFPTDTALKSTHLANYSDCTADGDILGCALLASSSLHHAASDGTDVGADIAAIKAFTDIALSGQMAAPTPSRTHFRLRIRGGE